MSLTAEPGQVLALLGASGSGKTTLLRLLGLLLAAEEGEVRIDGKPTAGRERELRQRIAMVGQRPAVFRTNAFENVVYGLRVRGAPDVELHSAARRAMERFGIWHLQGEPARRLSGGEQQRVAFARALVCGPDVLLLDEFTASLDPVNARALEAEVRRIARQGSTVIAATHDLGTARRLADRVVLLAEGRVAEEAPAKAFFEAPQSAEGKAFLGPRDETY